MRRPLAILGLLAACAFARSGASEPPATAQSPATATVTAVASSAPASSTAASIGWDATKVRDALRDLASDAKGWGGAASGVVIDVATGAQIAAVAEHAPMNPASNAKLATAAAALRVLGPEHRFLTGVYGKQKGSRVAALVIRGFGDPTLGSDDVAALARELKSRGVRKVDSILVDQGYFDDAYTPPAFAQQPNEWAPFRAPVSAVAVNGNTVMVIVRPGEDGKPASVTIDPPGVATVDGTVRTAKKGDPEKVGVSLSSQNQSLTVKLSGHVPEGGDPVKIVRRLEDPRLAAGHALRAALAEVGIEAADDVRQGGEREKELLAAHRSDTLAHVLAKLGKDSDNFVAEMVFKALAAEKKGRPATFAAAGEVVAGELRAMGAFEQGCSVTNGSGLFDANRTTAVATAALLRSAWLDSKIGPELTAQLAVGGVDGTLRSRFKAWSKSRAVRAKTGTLHAAFALSGYVLGPPGESPVAFALFVNGAPGKAGPARASLDRVVDAIARGAWRGGPP